MSADQAWQYEEDVMDRNSHMLEEQIGCDVMFTFPNKDGENFKQGAHQAFLIRESPVMESMFCGQLKPHVDKDGVYQVEITDIDPAILKIFLRYLYTRKLEASIGDIIPLVQVSQKYMTEILSQDIIKYIKSNINFENACDILNDAVELKQSQVYDTCLHAIAEDANYVFSCPNFLEVNRETLRVILSHDKLDTQSELVVVEACRKWAKHQANDETLDDAGVRKVLGNLFSLIRFPAMKPVDFDACWESNMFSIEEKAKMYHYILSKDNDFSDIVDAYSIQPRLRQDNRTLVRHIQFETKTIYAKKHEYSIDIKVDKPVAILGFVIVGPDTDYKLTLNNYKANDSTDIPSTHHKVFKRINPKFCSSGKIMLKSEMVMQANFWYTSTSAFEVDDARSMKMCQGTHGTKSMAHECGVKFSFRRSDGLIGEVEKGQISEIVFVKRGIKRPSSSDE